MCSGIARYLGIVYRCELHHAVTDVLIELHHAGQVHIQVQNLPNPVACLKSSENHIGGNIQINNDCYNGHFGQKSSKKSFYLADTMYKIIRQSGLCLGPLDCL